MAIRPVFITSIDDSDFLLVKDVTFTWYPGFSKSQKQKSIEALHENFLKENKNLRILEISSSSVENLGVKLSAFNLMVKDINGNDMFTVECVFQACKKFKNGGPYKELLYKSSLEAKKDARLKSSGDLVCFVYKNEEWGLEPKTHFYDWIYINAIHQNKELADKLVEYDAFTDIEFNQKKSMNCQARSAALYVALYRKGILNNVISSKKTYLDFVSRSNQRLSLASLFTSCGS